MVASVARTPGGQESLVYLRVSRRPSPRPLSVVYRKRPAADVRHFGPYLGGVKVRRAVTGLYRALPLDRAGTELRGAHLDLEAVDWITGPQRVTSVDPSDLDVCGWAGGTLVHFGIRAGRLCQWSQRSCPQTAAAGPLAKTPAAWAPFATVNAELAAILAG
jgi:excinuclease ABC subunit C